MIIRREGKTGVRYGVRIDTPDGRVWVGTFPKLGKVTGDPETEAKAAEARALLTRRQSLVTCDGFALDWLKAGCPTRRQTQKKTSTLSGSRHALNRFARDFRGVRLSDVDRDQAYAWATGNRGYLPYVRGMYNQARNRGLVDHNPFEKLDLPRGDGRRDNTPLSEHEMLQIADVALDVHGDYGHTMKALVLVAAYTGMRAGELYALEWEDLDLEQETVHVQRATYEGAVGLPKSNRKRVILLPPPARTALQNMARQNAVLFGYRQTGLVFPAKKGGMLSTSHMSNPRINADGTSQGYWRRIREAHGRPELHFHELRHFAGHFFYITLGCTDAETAYQLGHRDGGRLVRELYGHGDHGALDRLRRAFDRPTVIGQVANRSQPTADSA